MWSCKKNLHSTQHRLSALQGTAEHFFLFSECYTVSFSTPFPLPGLRDRADFHAFSQTWMLSVCQVLCCTFIHPSTHPPTHPSIHPTIHPLYHPSVHSTIYPPNHPPIHPSTHPSIQPPIHPSIHPPAHSLFRLSLHWSLHLSFHPSFIQHLLCTPCAPMQSSCHHSTM